MKTVNKIILAVILAGNAIGAQAQDQRKESPEYYAVYESAFHETSKLGVYPSRKIYVSGVEVKSGNVAIRFKEPVSGPAIINIYDEKGKMILNQYMELNGSKTEFPLYGSLANGVQFLHIFTEKSEAIYQFKNESASN